MNNLPALWVAALFGAMFGALFFGGLWWTVQKGLVSNHPALWLFGSTLLRTGLVLAGFFFVASGDWRKLLACLLGFFIARIVITRLTRISMKGPDAPK
jgi:F1F0 ATPase subunit 2